MRELKTGVKANTFAGTRSCVCHHQHCIHYRELVTAKVSMIPLLSPLILATILDFSKKSYICNKVLCPLLP